MKTCPSGHENPDDATRCAVCLRRLPVAAVTVEFTELPAAPVAATAGTTTTIPVSLVQHAGAAASYHLELAGEPSDWGRVAQPTVELVPGQPYAVDVVLAVPDATPPGRRHLAVEARNAGEGRPAARAELVVDVAERSATPPAPGPAPTPTPSDETVVLRREEPADREPRPVLPSTVPGGGGERPRPRPWLLGAMVGAATLVAAAFLIARLWGDDLSADEALRLSAAEAREHLDAIAEQDRDRVSEHQQGTGALLQLSSKCNDLTSVDLQAADGTIGVPDGEEEPYPGGIGDSGILAFHLGAREHWGDGVLLTQSERFDGRRCADGDPFWLTLDEAPSGGAFDTVEAALCECVDRGLPFGECAARPLPVGLAIFHTPETLPLCRDL